MQVIIVVHTIGHYNSYYTSFYPKAKMLGSNDFLFIIQISCTRQTVFTLQVFFVADLRYLWADTYLSTGVRAAQPCHGLTGETNSCIHCTCTWRSVIFETSLTLMAG